MSLEDCEYSGIVSHWCHLFEGIRQSPQEFYRLLREAVDRRNVAHIHVYQKELPEGSMLSAHRKYLQIWCKNLVFEVCVAPFGTGFFVSWWLRQPEGCLFYLLALPVFGRLFWLMNKPMTYYRLDTALMFQESVHSALMEVIDELTSANGVRTLTEEERKPIMRDFFEG